MRAGLIILCTLFLITSCTSKDKIPNNILPQKKMQAVLWDMMRADQFLSDYVLRKDSSLDRKTESIKLYQKIFIIHKINKEVFQKSLSFYKFHPVFLKVIMDSLSKTPAEIPAQVVRPQAAGDSTLKLKRDSLRKDTVRSFIKTQPAGDTTLKLKKDSLRMDTIRRFKRIKRML